MLTESFILAIIGLSYSVSMNAENRLHHELLHIRSYSKLIRPTGNDSLKLTVKIGLRLSQLLDIVSIFYLSLKLWG